MAYASSWTVNCKNILCEKSTTVHGFNGIIPNPLPPCPHCGFRTLSQFHLTTAMVEEIKKGMEELDNE